MIPLTRILARTPRIDEDSPDYQHLHLVLRQKVDHLLSRCGIPLRKALEWAGDEYHITVGLGMRELTAGQLARWLGQIERGELGHLSTRGKQDQGRVGRGEPCRCESDPPASRPRKPRLRGYITGQWG